MDAVSVIDQLPSGTRTNGYGGMRVLSDVEGVKICELTTADVVRPVMVQRIVQAYEEYEKVHAAWKGKK